MIRQALALLLVIACLWAAPAAAANPRAQRVILVLWHGLTWADAAGLELQGAVAWGLLNTRTGGGESLTAAYLSVGAGARAVGWPGAAAFLSREAAEYSYRLHTGQDPGSYVQPHIALIQEAQAVNYRVELGALGTALAEAGEGLKVLGSSAADDEYHWAALVGMDRWGRIWSGELNGPFTVSDPRYPFGLRTDYTLLAQEALEGTERLVVVDLGDPFRFDRYQRLLLPGQREVARAVMAADARRFVWDLALQKPEDTVVLIISPHPGESAASAGRWLTPVLCLGWGEGLLTSATTRWPGIITNMDVAPTILALLGIHHNQPFIGREAWVEEVPGAPAALASMVEKIEALSRWRGGLLRLVVTAQIVLYGAVLAVLIPTAPIPGWGWRLLQTVLLALLAVPLALLVWDVSVLLSGGIVLAVVLLSWKYPHPLLWSGVLSVVTAGALAADTAAGSWLMRYSPLGYDPVGGARFYGIGNEYMGVLVGASIMAWALLAGKAAASRAGQLVGLVLFAGLVVLIGAPSLGTNAGGAVSAVCGFAAVWLACRQRRVGWLGVVLVLLCAVLVLGVFTLLDQANPPAEQSHFGQTAELLRRDGLGAIFLIVRRKLEMNLRLLRFSIWSKALIVTLTAMAASFIWPSRFIAWLRKNHPQAAKGISGVVVGAVAALIFNDSGVVAAATCISFGSTPLLLMALKLKHDLAAPEAHIEDDAHRD